MVEETSDDVVAVELGWDKTNYCVENAGWRKCEDAALSNFALNAKSRDIEAKQRTRTGAHGYFVQEKFSNMSNTRRVYNPHVSTLDHSYKLREALQSFSIEVMNIDGNLFFSSPLPHFEISIKRTVISSAV